MQLTLFLILLVLDFDSQNFEFDFIVDAQTCKLLLQGSSGEAAYVFATDFADFFDQFTIIRRNTDPDGAFHVVHVLYSGMRIYIMKRKLIWLVFRYIEEYIEFFRV